MVVSNVHSLINIGVLWDSLQCVKKANKQIYWYMYTLASRKGVYVLGWYGDRKSNGVI